MIFPLIARHSISAAPRAGRCGGGICGWLRCARLWRASRSGSTSGSCTCAAAPGRGAFRTGSTHRQGRLNADLVGLYVLIPVFVPAGGYDVPAGVDLPVDHKVDDVAFLDGVAASFLPGADVGDQIELQQIVRRPLADMAGLAQLFLVHDLRVLFEFLCIVCHDEAPFRISVRKGASSVLSGSLFSCLTSCKRARTAAFYARSRFYLNSGAVQISSGRNGSKCPQSLAVPGFPAFHKAA